MHIIKMAFPDPQGQVCLPQYMYAMHTSSK